jgi:hypothetical protein
MIGLVQRVYLIKHTVPILLPDIDRDQLPAPDSVRAATMKKIRVPLMRFRQRQNRKAQKLGIA